jgi:hypothetical protein
LFASSKKGTHQPKQLWERFMKPKEKVFVLVFRSKYDEYEWNKRVAETAVVFRTKEGAWQMLEAFANEYFQDCGKPNDRKELVDRYFEEVEGAPAGQWYAIHETEIRD